MESKNTYMKTIFDDLSASNKDLLILIAKSVRFTQQTMEQNNTQQSTAQQAS
ncbi:MAG: hypothetical protein ACLVML_00585 [Candidatus Gastranaerophilaceae bacterium]|nr:hypothetical protein [Christensenellales bacterium]